MHGGFCSFIVVCWSFGDFITPGSGWPLSFLWHWNGNTDPKEGKFRWDIGKELFSVEGGRCPCLWHKMIFWSLPTLPTVIVSKCNLSSFSLEQSLVKTCTSCTHVWKKSWFSSEHFLKFPFAVLSNISRRFLVRGEIIFFMHITGCALFLHMGYI